MFAAYLASLSDLSDDPGVFCVAPLAAAFCIDVRQHCAAHGSAAGPDSPRAEVSTPLHVVAACGHEDVSGLGGVVGELQSQALRPER